MIRPLGYYFLGNSLLAKKLGFFPVKKEKKGVEEKKRGEGGIALGVTGLGRAEYDLEQFPSQLFIIYIAIL